MKTSSAAQLELEYPTAAAVPRAADTISLSGSTRVGSSDETNATAPPLLASYFGNMGNAYAISSRRTGRLNAATISPREHEALLQERQKLLDKKFDGTLTRSEGNRLEYVRWSLDRIEDAKHGQMLDRLEAGIAMYEKFASDLKGFQEKLEGWVQPAQQKRNRERRQ